MERWLPPRQGVETTYLWLGLGSHLMAVDLLLNSATGDEPVDHNVPALANAVGTVDGLKVGIA